MSYGHFMMVDTQITKMLILSQIWRGWSHDSITVFTQMHDNSNVKATPACLPSEGVFNQIQDDPTKIKYLLRKNILLLISCI
jgi:hypothetical protein